MLKTIIIYVTIGVVTATPKICCDSDSVVLLKKTACWNPKTNIISNLTSLTCERKLRIFNYTLSNEEELFLMDNGDRNFTAKKDIFCIANQTTKQDAELKNITPVAMVCIGGEDEVMDDRVSGYCMIISIVFFVLVAIVYIGVPDLRDLQGKSIASFAISMALALLVLVIMKLVAYADMKLCAVRGFLAYFFVLSSFFWTNAISIQMLLNIRRPTKRSYSMKDYLYYATYAWGVPILLTLSMAVVNFAPGGHSRPGIGLNHCWFYDLANQWYYMYSVMSILIIVNIGIFIYISVVIWRSTFATSHLKALKYKLHMTIRLFVVMGISWIFEMISSSVQASIVWAIIDIFNTLQGLLIFLLLVMFRRRAIRALYKHGWLNCISGAVEKHLAVGEDDEQDVIEHNKEVPLQDAN